jgi:hypothetical protein
MTQSNTFKKVCLAILCMIAVTLYSCKKNDTATPTSAQISLLTSGTWKIYKLEFQNSNGSWTTVAIPSIETNATISFNKDNTYFGSYTGSSGNGSWKFSADYSQLYLVNPNNNYSASFQVNVLTQSTLQIQVAGAVAVNGTTYYAERDTFIQ